MTRSPLALALAAAGALAAGLAPAHARAAVTVKGSDTMVILVQRWAEHYMSRNAGRKIQVTGGGSGTGLAALINGTTDVASSSRPIKPDEAARVRDRHGVPPVETAVARDGVALYVNAANGVSKLTVEQIRAIYQGDVTNWRQVGGADAPIVPYSRENSSGTYVFFKDHVLNGEDFAASAQTLPGTAAVVNAVAKERNGIGYGGAAYARGVKELQVVGQDGRGYLPSAENVKSGRYPLSRPLFVYTRGPATGEARAFIDHCLSAEGQAAVVEVGYFPVR